MFATCASRGDPAMWTTARARVLDSQPGFGAHATVGLTDPCVHPIDHRGRCVAHVDLAVGDAVGVAVERGQLGQVGEGVLRCGAGGRQGSRDPAETEPLLVIRPPCGRCERMTRKASRVFRRPRRPWFDCNRSSTVREGRRTCDTYGSRIDARTGDTEVMTTSHSVSSRAVAAPLDDVGGGRGDPMSLARWWVCQCGSNDVPGGAARVVSRSSTALQAAPAWWTGVSVESRAMTPT